MPWIIGIDEAGYGPNLGPLVMTSVACQVPEKLVGADLWSVLDQTVRRHPSADDGRLLIEDSKVVYSTARGLLGLETGVLATVSPAAANEPFPLGRLLALLCPSHLGELSSEAWFSGASLLPVAAAPAQLSMAAARFANCCAEERVVWGLVRSVIVCPRRFNALLDHWGSKGAVLGQGLAELARSNRQQTNESESLNFIVDKHGGRNNYSAMLQQAFPDGLVIAREEGMARSVYQVTGLGRSIRFTMQPRADAEHFCVALASMVSKYVRELLMLEFNRFWQTHVPGVKPTAGYPGDAARFFADIRPALEKLAIPETAIWRRK
jgi:ribonuclease HII